MRTDCPRASHGEGSFTSFNTHNPVLSLNPSSSEGSHAPAEGFAGEALAPTFL